MIEDVFYKVLWVEDDPSIIQSFQINAEGNGIELDVASNWEDAEEKLRINFDEYSAIVLDAQCKIKKTDKVPSKLFLGHVSVRLSRICGEKHKFIPWYVLSAGTMDDFGVVLELINTEERKNLDSLWGPLKYIKGGTRKVGEEDIDEEDLLFNNIKKVASSTGVNTVLFRHAEVFKYVGEGRIIDYIKARTYLLKMLSALYYPEENLNFVYEGNPLRKVIEYVFRGANKYGLLPDDCFEDANHIRLLDASRYMAGLDTNVYEGRNFKYKIRFGNPGQEKEGAGGDCIFDQDVAMFVKNILNYSSSDSHTNEDDPYIIEEDKKEIFFGYVLQLCHVVKWVGNYIESHPDMAANKAMIKILPLTSTSNSKEAEKTEDKKDVEKKQPVFPTKEEIIGSEYPILNMGKLTCGPYCKIDSVYSSQLGKKAIIMNVIDNIGKDTKDFPYIADKIEIVE